MIKSEGKLNIGDYVSVKDLSEYKGIYFLIEDPKRVADKNGLPTEIQGKIAYMKETQDTSYYEIINSERDVLAVYHRDGDYFEY